MGPGPWIGYAHRGHAGPGWGVWLLGILMTVAFWALVVLAIIWLVRTLSHRGTGTAPDGRYWTARTTAGTARYPMTGPGPAQAVPAPATGTAPEQILAERFARGEIDEGEYRARLAVLRGPAEGTPPAAQPPDPPSA